MNKAIPVDQSRVPRTVQSRVALQFCTFREIPRDPDLVQWTVPQFIRKKRNLVSTKSGGRGQSGQFPLLTFGGFRVAIARIPKYALPIHTILAASTILSGLNPLHNPSPRTPAASRPPCPLPPRLFDYTEGVCWQRVRQTFEQRYGRFTRGTLPSLARVGRV